MKMKKSLLILAQTALFWLALTPLVTASTSTYYLDTSRLELTASPSTNTASGVIKVSSNSNHNIRLRVIPKLWQLSPQGVVNYITPPAQGFNLLDNIGINPEEFVLMPDKSRLVRFIVKMPDDVKDAEYPFQLYFEPTDQLEPSKTAVSNAVNNIIDVVPIFTTTVYVYKGNPMPKVQVDQFQCKYQPTNKQYTVQLKLSNQGAKHARLFGNAIVSNVNAKGAPLEVLHLQDSNLIIVFPNTPRIVENALPAQDPKTLPPGHYQMELQLVDERNEQPALQSTCTFDVPNP